MLADDDAEPQVTLTVALPCYAGTLEAAIRQIEETWAVEHGNRPHRTLVDVTRDKVSGNRIIIINAREL